MSVIAGVTNDVCAVFPALSLVGDGYDVQVIADAGGPSSKMSEGTEIVQHAVMPTLQGQV